MKAWAKFVLLGLFSLLAVMVAICVGSIPITVGDIFSLIMGKGNPANATILMEIRIPRVASAFVVGAALSVSGTIMQSILQNPLASSYTLGVSSGASLGASLVLISGFTLPFAGYFTLPIVGFLFGFLTVLLAIVISQRIDGGLQNQTVILVGMVLSLFVNAMLSLVSALFRGSIRQLVLWQMGSFSGKNWSHFFILAPISLVTILFLLSYHREMDMLSFGDRQAQSMGVNTNRVKWQLLVATSLLTGTAVCFTGVIGFIDLISPHLMRRIFGSSHRRLVPAAALFGGGFMVLSDTVARYLLSPTELPVGAVMALIGAPFFAFLYARTKRSV